MAASSLPEIEEIVRRYADMVYRIARLHTLQEKDAEDIFQETFLRLVKHIHKLKNEEHLKAWLIRVTINCCKSQTGSTWNQRVVVTEKDVLEGHTDQVSEFQDGLGDSEVYEAVKSLSPKYRDVIHLFYYEDLSIKEISKVLECREGTVKSQLTRAREQLSQIIENPFKKSEEGRMNLNV